MTDVADTVGGALHRTYDGLNRLTQEATAQGTVTYTYDDGSRRTTMTVAGQPAVSYTYDNANRLTQIQSGPGGSGLGTVSITYDAANRRQTVTLGNGVQVAYSYDDANQLTGLTYTRSGTTIGTLTYTYDADGRRTAVGGTLAQVVLPQAITSATYNANNQLLQWGDQTYSYDLNGNVTGDGSKTFTWDSRDQLTALTGSVSASFGYDGFGRRVSRTVSGIGTGYLYDGLNFVQELTGATPKANLLTGRTLDEVFVRNQGGAASNVLPDALGSAIGLTDTNGAILSSYAYEPYGATAQAGATNENSQQFTGRENDGTGLMYYRARYYVPNCGRFASEDPIGIAGGLNVYGYTRGDPTDWTDSTGLVSTRDAARWVWDKLPFARGCEAGAAYRNSKDDIDREFARRSQIPDQYLPPEQELAWRFARFANAAPAVAWPVLQGVVGVTVIAATGRVGGFAIGVAMLAGGIAYGAYMY